MNDTSSVIAGTAEVIINGDGPYECEFEIVQQYVMVRSDLAAKPDPHWEHTDPRGHVHTFAEGGRLPTLRRENVHVPCDGSCGFEGGCEGYTVPKYHCEICNETVEPRYEPDYEARTVGVPVKEAKSTTLTVRSRGLLPEETVTLRVIHRDGEMIGIGDVRLTEWDSEHGATYEVFARTLEPRMSA